SCVLAFLSEEPYEPKKMPREYKTEDGRLSAILANFQRIQNCFQLHNQMVGFLINVSLLEGILLSLFYLYTGLIRRTVLHWIWKLSALLGGAEYLMTIFMLVH